MNDQPLQGEDAQDPEQFDQNAQSVEAAFTITPPAALPASGTDSGASGDSKALTGNVNGNGSGGGNESATSTVKEMVKEKVKEKKVKEDKAEDAPTQEDRSIQTTETTQPTQRSSRSKRAQRTQRTQRVQRDERDERNERDPRDQRDQRDQRTHQNQTATNNPFKPANTSTSTPLSTPPTTPRIRREFRRTTDDYSYAYCTVPTYFYSDAAQQFFERNFQWVDRSLLVISLVGGILGGPDLAKKYTQEAEDRCGALHAQLSKSVEELRRVMEKKGIPQEAQIPGYDHKRLYKPAIHSPQAMQFVALTRLLDQLIARIEGAWINGVIDAEQRQNMIRAWLDAGRKYVASLQNLRAQTMQEALNAGKRQEARMIEQRVDRDSSSHRPMTGKDDGAGAVQVVRAHSPEDEASPASYLTEAKVEDQESQQDPEDEKDGKTEEGKEEDASGIDSAEYGADVQEESVSPVLGENDHPSDSSEEYPSKAANA